MTCYYGNWCYSKGCSDMLLRKIWASTARSTIKFIGRVFNYFSLNYICDFIRSMLQTHNPYLRQYSEILLKSRHHSTYFTQTLIGLDGHSWTAKTLKCYRNGRNSAIHIVIACTPNSTNWPVTKPPVVREHIIAHFWVGVPSKKK